MRQKIAEFQAEATSILRSALPFDAMNSYHNPRLEDESYFSQSHLEEIRRQSAIVEWTDLGKSIIQGIGELRKIGIITEQGYCYAGFVGIPEKPESSVPVIGTSAWFTSIEGHNEHSVRNLMRAGNFVLFLGSEGSYEPEIKPEPQSPISLANSAAAVLNFSHHYTRELAEEGHAIDLEKRIAAGESRGAMVGMGVVAMAEHFAQKVVFADLTAPCLPRPMELSDLKDLASQIYSEPREIIKLAGSLTLGRLVHYPATLDLSPYNLKHQVAIGFALFSGEAGELARHISNEALLHITTFEKDFASMKSEWEDIFANHDSVRITPLPGSHLTLADLETLQFIIGRNKAAQICIAEDEPLTPATVFDAAHLFAQQQQPIPYAA